MSRTDAEAFLERAENDKALAVTFDEIKDDQEAVLAKVRAAGYEATHEEVLQAFMERYGAELTPEQLDRIAAGGA